MIPASSFESLSTEELAKAIGTAIRQRRYSLGMSLESLAERAGISDDTVSRIEHGATETKFYNLCAVADALGQSLLSFFPASESDSLLLQKIERIKEIVNC